MILSNQSLSKYMSILICVMPFLLVYDNSFITYIQLVSFAAYIFIRLKSRGFLIRGNALVVYAVYSIAISLLMGMLLTVNSVTINRTISSVLYVFFLICSKEDNGIDYVKKVYKMFAIFCVLFFVFQILCFYLLNKGVMFQLPFLRVKTDLEMAYKYLSLASAYGTSYVRFPGPFSEPSTYAVYVIPLIAFYLFDSGSICRKNIIKACLIASTVLMSTSGMGIVLVAACFTIYALNYSKNKLVVIYFVCIVFIAIILLYQLVPAIKLTVDNLFVVGSINSTNSKADYRLYRGIEYFFSLPIIYKLFGVGLYNAEAMSKHLGIVNSYDRVGQNYEYFNGFSQMFIYTGIIGALLIILYLFFDVRYEGSSLKKAIFILYLGLIIGSSALFDGIGLIYLVLLLVIDRNICREELRVS